MQLCRAFRQWRQCFGPMSILPQLEVAQLPLSITIDIHPISCALFLNDAVTFAGGATLLRQNDIVLIAIYATFSVGKRFDAYHGFICFKFQGEWNRYHFALDRPPWFCDQGHG